MVSSEPEGTTIALRNKRSRRVSFATKIVASVHEFDRDEEDFEPPPHRPKLKLKTKPKRSSVVKDEFLLFFDAMGVDPDDDSHDFPCNAEELDVNAGSEFVEKGDVVKVNEGGNTSARVDEISGSEGNCLNGGECVISGLVDSNIDIEAQMQACDSESRFTERSFIVEGRSREMRMEGAELVQMTGLSLFGDKRGLEVKKIRENEGKIDNKLVVLNETDSAAKAEEDSCITCEEENQNLNNSSEEDVNDVEEEAPKINRVSKSSDSDESKDYELPSAIMAECKGEHGSQTRERRRSTYLSPSYYDTDRFLKFSKEVFKIPKVSSGRKFNTKQCQNPIDYSNNSNVINISSNESLSQLQMAAIDSHHPNQTKSFDSMKMW